MYNNIVFHADVTIQALNCAKSLARRRAIAKNVLDYRKR